MGDIKNYLNLFSYSKMEYDIMNDLLSKTVKSLFEKKVNLEENERNWKLMLSAEKNRLK